METVIIAAIIASVTTLAGVFLGHCLAVSRRKERFTDFLYQERFKAYMGFISLLEDLYGSYYEIKWDEEGIKKLSRIWDNANNFIIKNILVFTPAVSVKVADILNKLEPKNIVSTKNTDFFLPCLEIIDVITNDLQLPYFDKEIRRTMEKFTRRNQPENMKTII